MNSGRFLPGRIQEKTTAWADRRNRSGASVDWQFTAADARIKLKRLYPKIDD